MLVFPMKNPRLGDLIYHYLFFPLVESEVVIAVNLLLEGSVLVAVIIKFGFLHGCAFALQHTTTF